jgi:uncharacterized membrane protein YoaK (UPF0700 family)
LVPLIQIKPDDPRDCLLIDGPLLLGFEFQPPMDRNVSLASSAGVPINREEALPVAVLLALAGGYLEAYTWITHKVFANAQTANLVFLWVYATAADWPKALHYVPPLVAFAFGVTMASFLRWFAGDRAGPLSILIEIVFLFAVGIIHNRLPGVAGTLGISFVAAMQTSSFSRVERWTYSSVMATSNFRQSIEGLFAAFAGDAEVPPFRRPYVFAILCAVFGAGAAVGAYVTMQVPALAMGIPVTLLLIALLRCEQTETSSGKD